MLISGPQVLKTPHPRTLSTSQAESSDSTARLGFPWAHYPSGASNQTPAELRLVSGTTYDKISRMFNKTCVSSSLFRSFGSDLIPTLDSFSVFVHHYIEHFQPVLPFIHATTFDPANCHWLLTLAVASIGSHYVEAPKSQLLVRSMHEFLRRTLLVVVRSQQLSKV